MLDMAQSVDRLIMARIKVNGEIVKFFVRNGGLAVPHPELERGIWLYLHGDGVYLNAIGLDMWFLGLQDGEQ